MAGESWHGKRSMEWDTSLVFPIISSITNLQPPTSRIPAYQRHLLGQINAWDVADLVDMDQAFDLLLEPLASFVTEQVKSRLDRNCGQSLLTPPPVDSHTSYLPHLSKFHTLRLLSWWMPWMRPTPPRAASRALAPLLGAWAADR